MCKITQLAAKLHLKFVQVQKLLKWSKNKKYEVTTVSKQLYEVLYKNNLALSLFLHYR